MDVLNFLKFWRREAMPATSTSDPRLGVEPDDGSEEDDSLFDLEFTVCAHDNSISKINLNPEDKIREGKEFESGNDQVSRKLMSLPPNESISKRKILPIEPVSKPQSPIALLKSAPSFRILMFKKNKEMSASKTEEMEDSPFSPSLSRSASTSRSHGSRSERFSKEVLNKYLKLIKPLYVKISGRNGEKVKLSGDIFSASTTSSPSVASVSLKKEKQRNIPTGIRGASKHLGKSKSASTITGIGSPARRSDDTLQLQYDGIQSAILHCKRSFNSREYASTITQSEEKSTCSRRNEKSV
ncbi:probable membrane-associated kinase regulator 5 [Neltuma alba]|uniref:probable membrane-associated kinase regulator 5 n=1 Tax=Neltuma alba TaxID=207710 RepID=UPI0010A39DCA|nr:probable membrane-associated kinase regulator 5 [Prosopis alba]